MTLDLSPELGALRKEGDVLLEYEIPPTRAIHFAVVEGARDTMEARDALQKIKTTAKIRKATLVKHSKPE